MSTSRGLSSVALSLLTSLLACATPSAHLAAPWVAPRLSAPSLPARAGAATPMRYWEPIELSLHGNAHGPDLPLEDAQVELGGAASSRWASAPESLRAEVRRDGFAILRSSARRGRLGAYYTDLRDAGVPFVITLDALFLVTHMAIDRALAEAEERTLAPALDVLLRRLDARLNAEQRGASGDMAPAYRVARGLVAVAQALRSPSYVVAPDLASAVAEDVKRVTAHAAVGAPSAVLGVALDFTELAPRGASDASEARASAARAMAWLGAAPLILVAKGEASGAGGGVRAGEVTVGTSEARTNARAALLLGRLLDPAIDADAARAFAQIARVSAIVSGPASDPSPRDLAAIAAAGGLDVKDVSAIANVVSLDRVRRAAPAFQAARLYDGAGGVRVGVPSHLDGESAPRVPRVLAASTSVRLFPGRAAPDAEVLQGLVFPSVGPLERDLAPSTARDGLRGLPTALDVAAWLGASEARTVLHEQGDDAFEGYDDAMKALYARRPPAAARHESVYMSALDAIATMLTASAGDGAEPFAGTSQWRRRKLGVALSAWTMLRHDMVPFARFPAGPLPPPTADAAAHEDAPVAFVEPAPETIAKLLALVRQTARSVWDAAALSADAPAMSALAAIDAILVTALSVAVREANDEPLEAAESAALDDLPRRLAALDAVLAESHAADVSMAVDVHTDLGPARALEEATGDLDDLYLALREPRRGRIVLAIGASLPHYELAQPAALRLTDDRWRARLHSANPPPRDAMSGTHSVSPAR